MIQRQEEKEEEKKDQIKKTSFLYFFNLGDTGWGYIIFRHARLKLLQLRMYQT